MKVFFTTYFMFVQGIRVYYTTDDERSSVSWLGCHGTQASKYSILYFIILKSFLSVHCVEKM